jgi:hypothetical protein
MEKYLIALLLCASSMAHAEVFETNQKIVCDDTETMFNKLKKTYGESVSIYAEQPSDSNPDDFVTVWLGENGTISVVETHTKYKISCLISAGQNARFKAEKLL